LVVALAMAVALLLGGGPLLVSQAATSAVLVATLQPPGGGFSFDRFFDAATGGAVAIVVSTLVLPVDPVVLVRRALEPVTHELRGVLAELAGALETRDVERAERALVRARETEPMIAQLREAVTAARDNARLSFRRARSRQKLERFAKAAEQVELAMNNVRVLARGVVRAISLGDATPPGLSVATRDLAAAIDPLVVALDRDDAVAAAREASVHAARAANAVMQETGNMSALHLVGQLRSTSFDLLRALGVPAGEAREAVRLSSPSS
jgi:uncharacterized membrane protein YgaE (UPF0421/DUF939 family)